MAPREYSSPIADKYAVGDFFYLLANLILSKIYNASAGGRRLVNEGKKIKGV